MEQGQCVGDILPPLLMPQEGMPLHRWGWSMKRTGAACGFHTAPIVETPWKSIAPLPHHCRWLHTALFSTPQE
jgi:hypothetical protein